MALPVTQLGSGSRTSGTPGPGHQYTTWSGRTKQARPYNVPTAFAKRRSITLTSQRTGQFAGFPPGTYSDAAGAYNPNWFYAYWVDDSSGLTQDALMKAREKFRAKISERAETMVNVAERVQAMDMIAKRLAHLALIAKAIKNVVKPSGRTGRRQALSDLKRLTGWRPKGNTKGRQFADLWLEYSFGWVPLAQDIYNSCQVLSKPFRSAPLSGRGVVRYDLDPVGYTTAAESYWAHHMGQINARFTAYAEVTNPNLLLAASLGLTNPAAVIWELIPFSFVVDWFTSVGDFLSSFSEFHGVKLINPHYSFVAQDYCEFARTLKDVQSSSVRVQSHRTNYVRALGVPGVLLRLKQFRVSPSRALTALALLRQFF